MRRSLVLVAVLALLASAPPASAEISAPDGVAVETVARGLPQPSNLTFDPQGRIWATSAGYSPRRSDGVWLVRRRGAEPVQVVRGLLYALGVAWHRGELYVSHAHPYGLGGRHTGRVVAYSRFNGRRFRRSRVVVKGIPVGLHNVDSLAPGPGGRLYAGVGSQSDNRAPRSRRSAAVISFLPSGRGLRVEARGLRNPYGLAFIPGTGRLLVSDNGRDDLGLNRPPDELNVVRIRGRARFYGFPRCWGDGGGSCRGSEPPLVELEEHAAAAGVAVSEDWAGQGLTAFVAEYGSSFPSNPTGNDVVAVRLEGSGSSLRGRAERFAHGFSDRDPVGAAIGPDGALYVTLVKSNQIVRFVPPASPQRNSAGVAGHTVPPELVEALGAFSSLVSRGPS
jgi:glucose/arabinose dehydrogenase